MASAQLELGLFLNPLGFRVLPLLFLEVVDQVYPSPRQWLVRDVIP